MEQISISFKKIFDKSPQVCCFAPGRVNLIGEHTDYNGGHVFPCAIHMGIHCAAGKRTDSKLRLYSGNFPDEGAVEYDLSSLSVCGCWADYPVSVVKALSAFGYGLPGGADMYFYGDLPDGAGLSSSAALEVVTACALSELYSIPVTGQLAAVIGQFAENRFIGVNCGIMDQFASAMGKKDSAILLDSDTLEYEYAPVSNASVVIVNSGVKHSLAASAYNQRRRECESACSDMKVPSLCSLSPEDFEERKQMISDSVCLRRAQHAVYENRRAIDAASALKQGDLELFGKLMVESHNSLRDLYEVSCEELDYLAGEAVKLPGVYGSRMTGGGFGGCTVNLMKPEAVKGFTQAIQSGYEKRFGIRPEVYIVRASDGAGRTE